MTGTRLKGLHRLELAARIEALREAGFLGADAARQLATGRQVLSIAAADRMIENVIGVFGLPLAVAPNFIVNGREMLAPLVVEEPSIVAGLTAAARLARAAGGFTIEMDESLLSGQVHVTDVSDVVQATADLEAERDALIAQADAVHPRLTARGGGVRDLRVRVLQLPDARALLTVHFDVDTCDAMGANLVNTICEAMAPEIARIARGRAVLSILSNLSDRSVVVAHARFSPETLTGKGFDGADVRDAIVLANDVARVDPFRAATHNKGIMNGVDAVAIATGNDWRAIEAGAHAWAALGGVYLPLTRWSVGENGDLCGEISMPLKVATVGGTLDANPAAALGIALTGVQSAAELAGLMAAVGLAQNFAALRALATSGIQAGHMKLHARSLVAAANAPPAIFDDVVRELVASGEIKRWKAEEIVAARRASAEPHGAPHGTAAGKVILFGEHAVVYGRHALALPIPGAVTVHVARAGTLSVSMPEWGFDRAVDAEASGGVDALLGVVLRELGIGERGFRLHIRSVLPRAMGLGSSAAVAVAVTRAFDRFLGLGVDDARVNEIAFACERIAHGTPSGIDNTLATYAVPMLFRNDGQLQIERLGPIEMPPLVVACSGHGGLTSEQVAAVRARRDSAVERFDALFDLMDGLSREGVGLLRRRDYASLGAAMNVAHGLLNAIGVSTPELERMVSLAREAGAAGAKLTGAGGGGSIVAVCPGAVDNVARSLQDAGFLTMILGGASTS